MGRDDTHAVRSHQHHAVARRRLDELVFAGPALGPQFREAGRHDHHGGHALLAALLEHAAHQGSSDGYYDQLGSLGQLGDARVHGVPEYRTALRVDRIDGAPETAQLEVGDQHAPPLGRIRGCAHHGDAARSQQRVQAGDVGRRPRAHLDRLPDRDEGVHGDRPRPVDEQRVDVDLPDLGMVGRHPAQRLQHVDERLAVDRRRPAEGAQQLPGLYLLEQFGGVAVPQGSHGEGHVTQGFGVDAAQAEHHHGSEETVVQKAGDELALTFDHVLHQHPVERGVDRGRPRLQGTVGLTDLHLVLNSKDDKAGVGLMLYLSRRALHDHRIADLRGQAHRFVGGSDVGARWHGEAVGGEELLARLLVEGGKAGGQGGLDQRAAGAVR